MRRRGRDPWLLRVADRPMKRFRIREITDTTRRGASCSTSSGFSDRKDTTLAHRAYRRFDEGGLSHDPNREEGLSRGTGQSSSPVVPPVPGASTASAGSRVRLTDARGSLIPRPRSSTRRSSQRWSQQLSRLQPCGGTLEEIARIASASCSPRRSRPACSTASSRSSCVAETLMIWVAERPHHIGAQPIAGSPRLGEGAPSRGGAARRRRV